MTTAKPTSEEIREIFCKYFEKQGHARVASSSLIPENDPTLLFANAGMNQFKDTFLGLEKRPYSRAVTVQKVVRAGGKHNDLDNVGFTARHHTFFEMLGNFSFGDYFKKDAIHMAWELLTKELAIPKEKLYVTVYKDDDDASDIWHKQEGVPRDRIFRFDQDNFWRMGDTGPCGPCSEIFFDHGPGAGKETDPFRGIAAGEDRFVEIWNLVFMQFYEREPGKLELLPKPSVDTGSGLERVVAALQGTPYNFNTDLFLPIIEGVAKSAGVTYQTGNREVDGALRVIADHARAVSFIIGDGGIPSNEGRGYVLRRILRRAVRYTQKISNDSTLFSKAAELVIAKMGKPYPALLERHGLILNTIKDEEAKFLSTLDQGTQLFRDEIARAQKTGSPTVSGDVAFKLYDTYGFPVDLTQIMATESGLAVDMKGFDQKMEEARQKAKASWKGKFKNEDHRKVFAQGIEATTFVGYADFRGESRVVSLSDGDKTVEELKSGQSGFLVVEATPFYAEGGGQIGDQGLVVAAKAQALVFDVTKVHDVYIHEIQIEDGILRTGDLVQLNVSPETRRAIANNHSATHLMHASLRKVLGTHVTQAGSVVDGEKLRFDFTHSKPMTRDEIRQVEDIVNTEIAATHTVQSQVTTYDKAVAGGAMALFGEKYGNEVRMVRMGDLSCELCGGTHVKSTAEIRFFKIVSETGVSSGVRRIVALTGLQATAYAQQAIDEALAARHQLGLPGTWEDVVRAKFEHANPVELNLDLQKAQIKALESEIRKLKSKSAGDQDWRSKAIVLNHVSVIVDQLDLEERDLLSEVADRAQAQIGDRSIVILLGRGTESRPLVIKVGRALVKTHPSGRLLKEVFGPFGGKGGGRPDFSQGSVATGFVVNSKELLSALEKFLVG